MTQLYDALFDALANDQRRRILFDLVDEPPQRDDLIDVGTLPDGSSNEITTGIERQHIHLPKLADYGFIEWQPGTNVVVEGARFAEVRPLLELLAAYGEEYAVDSV